MYKANGLNGNVRNILNAIGILIFFAFIMAVACIHIFQINIYILSECPLHAKTGYYCFGCGGTRAVDALLHGQIGRSIYYHPFVVYAASIYVLLIGSYILNRLTHGRMPVVKMRNRYLYIAPILIIVQCVIKNILHYQFGFVL